ncbi:glycosyltransferase family 4 protein [Desulfovermiculus halophilus]|uniref:glycosyltransferase family 4 protein n=1 Tax=Desulfovermiculus halophilus TaxID=339722 RepID=UPI000685BC9E|nr:glycosyltransferase family 4 protein [Desulfovermiculus halophilus]
MKTAIVHYWLIGMRGGEKVLSALLDIFPDADIFTHVYDLKAVSEKIANHNVYTSFIQDLPFSKRLYQNYLPLMPLALEQFDLRDYDLVISSESGPAKGVLTRPDALHICYCHTPMRYLWDMYHDYKKQAGPLKRLAMTPLLHYMRMWDLASAQRVDHFIANSNYVASRIRKYYRQNATVIYPPVAVDEFYSSDEPKDFYLMVGQLVGYKRADLAVRAFNRMGKRLVVIGDGEQLSMLQKIAKKNIVLMGKQPFEVIKKHFARCRALIFPGMEDFGIVPVEAMASGRPVIAYGRGGALETIVEGETGLFFREQSEVSIIEAVEEFEKTKSNITSEACRNQAKTFDLDRFTEEIKEFVLSACEKIA